MLRPTVSIPTLAAAAAALSIGFATAPASAEPAQDCTGVSAGQVCANTSESATPPVPAGGFGAANDQNGSYGPSGNTPPVGN